MPFPVINHCPCTLAPGHQGYSATALRRLFQGKKVSHILPYDEPKSSDDPNNPLTANRQRMSLSGVQEKAAFLLEKNRLRLTALGERSSYIVKLSPATGKNASQMPANEHLTMQIARQVYDIETAENALIFFENGAHAYISRRFDIADNGVKLAQDDFASLAGRTYATHGAHFKYLGNYLELFRLMEIVVPAYAVEAPKLLKLLLFNYLFSNGDAHLKNFSLLETPMADYRLSPAYDLLNSRIHVADRDFALDEGLLPPSMSKGKPMRQFGILAGQARIPAAAFSAMLHLLLSKSDDVKRLTFSSFLDQSTQRNYWQSYQTRLKQLEKI